MRLFVVEVGKWPVAPQSPGTHTDKRIVEELKREIA